MKRRQLFTAAGGLALAGAASLALLRANAQPRYTVSAEALQQAVAQRFPMRYPVAGLVNLDLQAPQMRLLPAQNRVGANMGLAAAGPALHRSYTGAFDVDFALRYEASDRTLRAYQLHVNALQLTGLRPEASDLLNTYGPALAEQALREVVLHRLRPQDLALADGLGMQPGSITVTEQGLVIAFVVKPPAGPAAS